MSRARGGARAGGTDGTGRSRRQRRHSPLGLSLRSGLVGVALVAPVALVLCGTLAGIRGLVSCLAGLALVAAFFLLTLASVEAANSVQPALILPVGMTVYGTVVVVLGGVLFGTRLPDHLQLPSFVWTTVAATLGWLLVQSIAVWRTKMPYVVIAEPAPSAADPGSGSVADAGADAGADPVVQPTVPGAS